MICNQNTKNGEKVKLLAVVAAFVVVACALATVLPSTDAQTMSIGDLPSSEDEGVVYITGAVEGTSVLEQLNAALADDTVETIVLAGVSVTLDANMTVPAGKTVYFADIDEGAAVSNQDNTKNQTYIIPAGVTLTIQGEVYNVVGDNADNSPIQIKGTVVMAGEGIFASTCAVNLKESTTANITGFFTSSANADNDTVYRQIFSADINAIAPYVNEMNDYSDDAGTSKKAVYTYGNVSIDSIDEGTDLSGVQINVGGVINTGGAGASTLTIGSGVTATFKELNVKSVGSATNNGSVTAAVTNNGTFTNNSKLTLTNGSAGEIDSSEKATVTIASDVSDVSKLTLNGGTVTDKRENPTTFGYIEEGNVYNVGGMDYTIYHFPFSGKNYQYGVYLEPIGYSTSISIESLAMTWLPFNYTDDDGQDVKMSFNPNMTISWYDDGTYNGSLNGAVIGPNYGVIMFSGSVYLGDNSTQPIVFNKILDLIIEPVPTTLEVTINGTWDIKQSAVGEPSFTYTYTDIETGATHIITSEDDLPEGCTITYYLQDTNGTRYEYPNWNAANGLTFEEASKTFTLVGEVTAWGNIDGTENVYAAANDTFQPVNLTNTTDLVSELVFGAPGEDAAYYGVSADRLQDGLTLNPASGIEFTPGSYTYNMGITATVYNLSSYVGFWGETADVPGYYVAFTLASGINGIEDFTGGVVTITNSDGEKKTFDGDFDGFFVLYLGKTVSAEDYTFTITYDADGAGTFYKETSYAVTIDVTSADWTYVIYLVDEAADGTEYNDTIYLDNDGYNYTEGDRIRLPNANGPQDQFLGWKAANGSMFQHDVYFLIQDKYADANGEIYLYAQYAESEQADVTDIIVDAQTQYEAGQTFQVNKVYAIYSNGTVADVTADVTYPADPLTTETTSVTVTYGDLTKDVAVTVTEGTGVADLATEVMVYVSSNGTGVNVIVQGLNGGVVDDGFITITYTYSITLGTSTLYRTVVMDPVPVDSYGDVYSLTIVGLDADNITNVMASYSGNNGSADDSNVILYTAETEAAPSE